VPAPVQPPKPTPAASFPVLVELIDGDAIEMTISPDQIAKFPPPPPANGEALAADQRPPVLTWAGEKLRPEWAAAFIAGQISYKPRPYLRARMPSFPARAGGIAAGLAESHGYAPTSAEYPKPDPEMAAMGRKLSGKTPNQAFQCVQCHAVADLPPFSPFEAPAINFTYARERLRKEYYHRWVHNPQRIDPNTKMPAFEREDGTTAITDVYGGDARKQIETIWQYLLEGREIKPPAE
jgi:mono/diheme cytochrome c family protein